MLKPVGLLLSFALLCACANADTAAFKTGPVIEGYGAAATVDRAAGFSEGTQFKIAFDVASAAEPGALNRNLESAARLINMHGQAGLPADATEVAVVVHGAAAMDLVTDERYGGENASAPLVAALVEAGVRIELCGQTAAYRDIAAHDLLPGVGMSVSAMTAHALLQQEGYSLNPF